MLKHVSIDIETLDTKPSALVLSIGLCVFNKDGITHTLYRELQIQCQISEGRTISESTLKFWLEQGQKFNDLIFSDEKAFITLAISDLNKYLDQDTLIWANSPDFDLVILEDLAKTYNIGFNWNFRNFRDFRTIRQCLAPDEPRPKPTHNALQDAIDQASFLIQHCPQVL